MKKILFASLIIFLCKNTAFAQWIQKTNISTGPAAFGAGFSIGTKVYTFTNPNGSFLNFNEYNTLTDTWTKKADFPGGFREAPVAFSIGGKGYLGMGNDLSQFYKDLWEYDPATDAWTVKANYPGPGREGAVAFSIGSKGYAGTGHVIGTAFNDFYEYDPAADAWTQKASPPGPARSFASACSVGNKGYLGFGGDAAPVSICYMDFYEYDPASDVWTAKNSGTGYRVGDGGMFAIGTDIYLLGGMDFSNYIGNDSCRRYNTLTDTWTDEPLFPAGAIIGPIVVGANGKGYVGTGFNATFAERSDWWEFSAAAPPAVSSVFQIADSAICKQEPLVITNNSFGTPSPTYSWSATPSTGVTFMPNSTANAPQVFFTNTGSYTITCIAKNSTGTSASSRRLGVSMCAGINATDGFTDLVSVSPNPSTRYFEIRSSFPEIKIFNMTLTNIMGQVMISASNMSIGPAPLKIDLLDKQDGIYFLTLQNEHEKVTKKLVLNK